MEAVLNNVYLLVLAVGITSTLGDIFINFYAKKGTGWWFIAGAICWVFAAAFFSQILKRQLFGPGVALFFLGNISVALLVGWLYFRDNVSPMQWIGVVLAVLSMVLILKGS